MSHVLGVVIKAIDAKYEAHCQALKLPTDLTWANEHRGPPSSIRRYPWAEFDAYLQAITHALRQHGATPLDFQRLLIPNLFSKLMTSRLVQRAFGPERLLRAVDIWAGPFMFRCGDSRVAVISDGRYSLTITIYDDLSASQAFFDHCAAGVEATFELMFPGCKVKAARVGERQLVVEVDTTQTVAEGRFDPPDLIVLDDLLILIDDVITDLEDEAFLDDLNLVEWHESLDHIHQVANVVSHKAGFVADNLTIASSCVQLAVQQASNPTLAKAHLAAATKACRGLRGEILRTIATSGAP